MQNIIDQIRSFKYIRETAFLFAVVLLVMAWKYGIEGITD